MNSPKVGECIEINREKQWELLEFSSVVFMKSGEVCRVSRKTFKETERVATGGRKPTKGHMKKRGDKAPFCPIGSEPRCPENGMEKCRPMMDIQKKYTIVVHTERLKRK